MFEAGPQPRDYQKLALGNLERLRSAGAGRALILLAPGLGKTWVAAWDAATVCRKGGRVLFLAHQAVILDQARRVFRRVMGGSKRFGRFDGERRDLGRDVTFAMFQSVHRALKDF